VESKAYQLDAGQVKCLTPGPKAGKVGLLEWHFKSSSTE
jgi:hypothetical protein